MIVEEKLVKFETNQLFQIVFTFLLRPSCNLENQLIWLAHLKACKGDLDFAEPSKDDGILMVEGVKVPWMSPRLSTTWCRENHHVRCSAHSRRLLPVHLIQLLEPYKILSDCINLMSQWSYQLCTRIGNITEGTNIFLWYKFFLWEFFK